MVEDWKLARLCCYVMCRFQWIPFTRHTKSTWIRNFALSVIYKGVSFLLLVTKSSEIQFSDSSYFTADPLHGASNASPSYHEVQFVALPEPSHQVEVGVPSRTRPRPSQLVNWSPARWVSLEDRHRILPATPKTEAKVLKALREVCQNILAGQVSTKLVGARTHAWFVLSFQMMGEMDGRCTYLTKLDEEIIHGSLLLNIGRLRP